MKSTRDKSDKQERGLARRYGGRVTPGSGNGWRHKNDVKTDTHSIEAKYTDKAQYTLKQADLHTAERHALLDGRDSLFVISFGGEEWAVIREPDFNALLRDREKLRDLMEPRPRPRDCGGVYEADQQAAEEKAQHEGWRQPMLPGADAW